VRRAVGVGVVCVLVATAVLVGLTGHASAAPVSATATAVDLQIAGACGANPQLLLSGQGVGDGFGEFGALTLPADPPPTVTIAPSALLDDWSFTGSAFGLTATTLPAPGDLVGGYAVVGDPSLAVVAEWFVMWRCSTGVDSATVVFSCAGPFGSCPSSVGEARTLDASVTPDAALPGETFTVTMEGCLGGLVVAGLFIPFAADPVISTGPLASTGPPVVGALIVPVGAAPTDQASVIVSCSYNADEIVDLPVRILASTTSTSAAPATAVASPPTFTG
jgi:hypothetical protein